MIQRMPQLPTCERCGRRLSLDDYRRWQRTVALEVIDVYCDLCVVQVLSPCDTCGALTYRDRFACDRCSLLQTE